MLLYINIHFVNGRIINTLVESGSMEETDILKKLIIGKLVRANIWGGKHTPLNFLTKGIPEHYRNTHQGEKAVEKVLKDLINAEWIIISAKRTGGDSDDHVSLNPRKISEIKQFLEKISSF